MRHRIAGRKLGRTSEHRLALLRNLSTALFDKEKIRTTLMRAKELRPFAEKLVTISKKETLHARRQVMRHINDSAVVSKLFDTLSARYAQRPGGYTRIIKLGPRRGDHAEMALIELVGTEGPAAADETPQPKRRRRKAASKAGQGEVESKPTKKKASVKKAKARKTPSRSKSKAGEGAKGGTRKKTVKKAPARKKKGD